MVVAVSSGAQASLAPGIIGCAAVYGIGVPTIDSSKEILGELHDEWILDDLSRTSARRTIWQPVLLWLVQVGL